MVGIGLASLCAAGASAPGIDDAFILLVYVRHFAESGQIYWNRGAAVDGFTSMLDMLIKAGAVALSPRDPVRSAWLVTMGCHALSAVLAIWLIRRCIGERTWMQVSVLTAGSLAIAGNRSAADGAGFMLETPLQVGCVLLALGGPLSEEEPSLLELVGIGMAWIGLSLCRPEGMLLSLGLAACFAHAQRRRIAAEPRRLVPVAMLLLGIGAYLTWHTRHFGAWAPNSYYAKTSDSRLREVEDGLAYVWGFVRSGVTSALQVAWIMLGPLFLAGGSWQPGSGRRQFGVASLAALAAVTIVILSGGDGYGADHVWRFLAVPTVLAVLSMVIASLRLSGPLRGVALACLGASCVQALVDGGSDLTRKLEMMRTEWPISASGFRCRAEAARRLVKLGVRSLAESDFQSSKFFADELTVTDLTGLNDRAIAHRPHPGPNLWGKGYEELTLDGSADAVSLGFPLFTPDPMSRFAVGQLLHDPGLHARYLNIPIPKATGAVLEHHYRAASIAVCEGYVNVFVQASQAPGLRASGLLVGPGADAAPVELK
jgi:hypothetical protein